MAQHGFFNLVSSDAPSDTIAFSDAMGQGDSVSFTQLAQVGAAVTAAPIGTVSAVTGTVEVTRANGDVDVIANGDPIFQGDVLATGDGGSVDVTLTDNSVFSLSPESSLTFDAMSFDQATGNGSLSLSLDSGGIVFASGLIASGAGGMTISTPSATMGIRDAMGGISVNDLGYTLATMFEGNGAAAGEMTLTTSAGTITTSQPLMALRSAGNEFAPPEPDVLTLQDLGQNFGTDFNTVPFAIASNMAPALVQGIDAALQQGVGDLGGVSDGGGVGIGGGNVFQFLTGILGLDPGTSVEDILAILTGDETAAGTPDNAAGGGFGFTTNNNTTTTTPAAATTAAGLNITCSVIQGTICSSCFTTSLDGGAGDDTICLKLSASSGSIRSGCVVICGSSGNDTVCVDLFHNSGHCSDYVCINGGGGDDTIRVSACGSATSCSNSFCLLGGAGNDTICLNACVPSNGDMTSDNFRLYGGTGNDTIRVDLFHDSKYAGNSVRVDGDAGSDTICVSACGGQMSCSNLFCLSGGAGNDTVCLYADITCGCGTCSNSFCLLGGGGDDTVCFCWEAACITSSTFCGNLVCMDGGSGNDTVCFELNYNDYCTSACKNCFCLSGGAGDDTVSACVCYDNSSGCCFYRNCFCLDGGTGNDTICLDMRIGLDGCTVLLRNGVNCLIGGAGTDTICVALNIKSSSSSRNCYCIMGGAGADTVSVNGQIQGNNNCWFFDYNATTEGGDTVNGFTNNNALFFRFSRAAFNGDGNSDNAIDAGQFVSGAGAAAADSNDYWLYDSTAKTLKYDADGTGAGAAVTIATMDANVALTQNNIVFDA